MQHRRKVCTAAAAVLFASYFVEVASVRKFHAGKASKTGRAWTKRDGLNCYPGVGADALPGVPEPASNGQNLQACQAMCSSTPGCTAIVMPNVADGACFLRQNVVESSCAPSSPYSTWLMSSGSTPPRRRAPNPPRRRAPSPPRRRAPIPAPSPPPTTAPPPPPSPGPCSDNNQFCGDWAANGECEANPTWMLENCALSCGACSSPTTPAPPSPLPDPDNDPQWGCGLLGAIPGIDSNGQASAETQRLIDGIKGSSIFNKVNYWNWNLVPELAMGQYLTSDFEFIPEMWGAGVVDWNALRPAGESNFVVEGSVRSPATMSHLFMGSNEPDIVGSCMGTSFGSCLTPDCCWGPGVVATGVGFWPFEGCAGQQPLPTMWEDPGCMDSVMGAWQQTAAHARGRGYKYLTTPLVAFNISYAEKFIQAACTQCQTIECGCPQYVGFHFYAYDCQPRTLGGYDGFQARLDEVADLMDRYPFIKGAIVNEVGMLNCQSSYQNPICVPDNGRYPASQQPNNACPQTEELPNGMASYVEDLFDMVINARTSDGRAVVKNFVWFMLDQAGGTYNQQIFNGNQLNEVGEAYIRNCQRWEQSWKSRAGK